MRKKKSSHFRVGALHNKKAELSWRCITVATTDNPANFAVK
jgi:hypothetical protein